MKEDPTRAMHGVTRNHQRCTINVFGMTASVKVASTDTKNAFCVIESTLPPHYCFVQPHWHAQKTETFFVIDGALTFTLDDQTFIAQRGRYVLVPPGTVHVYWNSTASPVTFLTISAPGGLDCFLTELSEVFKDRGYAPTLADAISTHYDQFSPTIVAT